MFAVWITELLNEGTCLASGHSIRNLPGALALTYESAWVGLSARWPVKHVLLPACLPYAFPVQTRSSLFSLPSLSFWMGFWWQQPSSLCCRDGSPWRALAKVADMGYLKTPLEQPRAGTGRDFCGYVFSSKPGAPCEHWGKENFWNQRELHGGVLNLGDWGCGWEKKLHFYFRSLPTANEHFLQPWIQTTRHSSFNSTCDSVASTNHRHFHIVLHILVGLSKYHLHSSLLWNYDGYLTYH